MDCSRDTLSPVSVDFNEAGELWPIESRFLFTKDGFDTFHCKLGSEAVQQIEDSLVLGNLDNTQKATVKIEGEPYRPMYFEPEFLKVGSAGENQDYYGFLELHDLHEHLKKGAVHYAPQKTTTEETFNEIYDAKVNDLMFTGLEINSEGEIISQYSEDQTNKEIIKFDPFNPRDESGLTPIEFSYSLHFDGDTPLQALKEARRKHSVNTHVSPDGKLVVGGYNTVNEYTASVRGRTSDYHIEDSLMGQRSAKISRLKIRGPIVNELQTGKTSAADRIERFKEYVNRESNETTGYRLNIIVDNPNVTNGDVLTFDVENINHHEEDLIKVGQRYFLAQELSANSGSLTLNMSTSNAKKPPKIKDIIEIDSYSQNCSLSSFDAQAGEYYVSEVESVHSSNSWKANLKLSAIPTNISQLNVSVKFYDINEDQTFSYKDIYGYELGEGPEKFDGTVDVEG